MVGNCEAHGHCRRHAGHDSATPVMQELGLAQSSYGSCADEVGRPVVHCWDGWRCVAQLASWGFWLLALLAHDENSGGGTERTPYERECAVHPWCRGVYQWNPDWHRKQETDWHFSCFALGWPPTTSNPADDCRCLCIPEHNTSHEWWDQKLLWLEWCRLQTAGLTPCQLLRLVSPQHWPSHGHWPSPQQRNDQDPTLELEMETDGTYKMQMICKVYNTDKYQLWLSKDDAKDSNHQGNSHLPIQGWCRDCPGCAPLGLGNSGELLPQLHDSSNASTVEVASLVCGEWLQCTIKGQQYEMFQQLHVGQQHFGTTLHNPCKEAVT